MTRVIDVYSRRLLLRLAGLTDANWGETSPSTPGLAGRYI